MSFSSRGASPPRVSWHEGPPTARATGTLVGLVVVMLMLAVSPAAARNAPAETADTADSAQTSETTQTELITAIAGG